VGPLVYHGELSNVATSTTSKQAPLPSTTTNQSSFAAAAASAFAGALESFNSSGGKQPKQQPGRVCLGMDDERLQL